MSDKDPAPEDASARLAELNQRTVDLQTQVVPAVRALLGAGLPPQFIASGVRVEDFKLFTGGLKAVTVGGLQIRLRAVLKLGGPELRHHRRVMDAVNARAPRTFVEVVHLQRLSPDRYLLLMEALGKSSPLLDYVYYRDTPDSDLRRLLDRVLAGVKAVHATPVARLERSGLQRRRDPFGPRIEDKLSATLAADPQLARMSQQPGSVMGAPCPPLDELLQQLAAWLPAALAPVELRLVHGDPHLRNVMVRRRGPGYSVRLIDPNPDVGISDPLYDLGKVLHWIEPVGWASAAPQHCRAAFGQTRGGWTLDAHLQGNSSAAERRRVHAQAHLDRRLQRLLPGLGPLAGQRLQVSIAAAHLGFCAILDDPKEQAPRRLALAHALAALLRWRELTTQS